MKQKLAKLSFLGLLVLSLIAMNSCEKFLDRKPLGVATDGDLNSGGLEGKVFGLYGKLRDWGMSDLPLLCFKSMRSDDARKGSTAGDIGELTSIMDGYQYTKDHWLLNNNWDDHYSFIFACNDVIKDIDSLQASDAPTLINRAEACFMRAYAYFDLVRDFGDVPIIDFKIYAPGDANVAKKTAAEVYAFIDADLTYASSKLPLTWGSQYPGRATKGTANTLHAKAMLYRKNWGGALAKCEEVIVSNQYSLLPNYSDYFKEKPGENSSESIFEIQMYESDGGQVYYGNSHNQVQGIRGSGDWDLGWGFNVPTTSLSDSYEVGDPRKGATILFEGQSDGIYGRTIPTGLASPMWNKKIYTDPARQASTGDRFGWWLNIRILRYADVLLMAAEAANELGGSANTTKALGYLETVRNRARGGANVLPAVTTTNQGLLRTAIKKERRAEFGMEWERFYDLVRWVPAADGIDAINVLGPSGYTNKCRYYPIPQPVLDRSNKLTQNPEW